MRVQISQSTHALIDPTRYTLEERGEMATPKGQRIVSILLLEDLAIVPLLALVAFLAPAAPSAEETGIAARLAAVGIGLGSILGLVAAGRYLLNPLFRILADSHAREVMTAAALLVVLGSALSMQLGGLSMAMGAFLAGVLLSESTFRHQLEADVEPFRGILLGLFFIAVGMSLDLSVVAANWRLIVVYVPAYMAVKALAIYVVARVLKSGHREALERAVLMAQGGEFAFVLYAAATAVGIINADANATLTAIVVISMALTPLLIALYRRFMPDEEISTDGVEKPDELRGNVLFALGMGPNQFFNNDLKDRAVFLLAALTANIGKPGGNIGSYAGNYRIALFNGIPQYINEDPFNLQLDPAQPARVKQYWVQESAHYYNHEDKPLRYGNRMLTGRTHMPTPTKTLWFANANSILGNVKWHYNVVNNVLPKIEMVCVNEWWWSTSCEYADVVFAVDSWAELKHPDMTASCTNSFLHMFPATEMQRVHETRGDIEVAEMVTSRLGELCDEPRFADMFRFVREMRTSAYLQRIVDYSTSTRGYQVPELLSRAAQGIPSIMMNRTTPRVGGWEQIHESAPFWTKSGRMEFYRDEPEFRSAGENLVVHREPIDSTFYEPNVILAAPHPAIQPEGPAAFGVDPNDLSSEMRQGRNVVKPWSALKETQHPLQRHDPAYKFVFHTPKYRHGVHTTPIDLDMIAVWFGPFGDIYRHDKRTPFVTEGYVDINPADAREIGVDDGDYVWIDADPEDRPFHGWREKPDAYKVARMMARARYYAGTPRGVTRMFFHMYGATPGSVRGQETRRDGLAQNANTRYIAMFRHGSHQSATRGWIKPTQMTDSLVRKNMFGHSIGKGFLADSHCPVGAPREAFVKITKAEPGGVEGHGRWRPVELGLRATNENDNYRRYLQGALIVRR